MKILYSTKYLMSINQLKTLTLYEANL
jgi:hypothetical protein